MRLTDRFDGDYITIDGEDYELYFAFDNILRVYELYDDKEVDTASKVTMMFDMLVIDCEMDLSLQQKSDLIEYILNNLLSKEDVDSNDEEVSSEGEESDGPKTHDFTKDAELIYASFLYDYNIDLFDVQGELHWNKFVGLFNSLSEKSALMKVIEIRTADIPQENKYNKKDRQKLIKAKNKYSLEKQDMNTALTKAASMLKGGSSVNKRQVKK